jgi:hypothetical protein
MPLAETHSQSKTRTQKQRQQTAERSGDRATWCNKKARAHATKTAKTKASSGKGAAKQKQRQKQRRALQKQGSSSEWNHSQFSMPTSTKFQCLKHVTPNEGFVFLTQSDGPIASPPDGATSASDGQSARPKTTTVHEHSTAFATPNQARIASKLC